MSLSPSNCSRVNYYRQIIDILVVAMPPLGFVGATLVVFFWERAVQPLDLSLFLIMYLLNVVGIALGYHRLFTHRAFQTGAIVRAFLAIAACMTGEGTVTSWVSHHRAHHLYCDRQGDPHSPNLRGNGLWDRILGFWHVHLGWIQKANWRPPFPYVPDLGRDRIIQGIDRFYILWVLLSFALPAILGGILTGCWSGVLRGLLWGGIIRIFVVHQVTYSVNSICHLWGKRRFKTGDRSTNNFFLALVILGEGWHHNHHAFPNSAKMGLKWWELDLGWVCILLLKYLGLVWNVKIPSSREIELKELDPA